VKKYEYMYLSSEDLLRDEVKSDSARGQQLKEIMQRGELVPNELVIGLMREAMLANVHKFKGFLIDFYMGNLEMAKEFEKNVKNQTF
jgi:adenylate kinase